MRKQTIEKYLRKENALLLDGVKNDIKSNYFNRRYVEKRSLPLRYRLALPLLAAIALLIGIIVIPLNQATTYLAFAINPEVQLSLNSRDKVVGIDALNVDGEVLIYDEDFRGLSLEEGVEKLMGLYDEFGFLDNNPTINMLSYHTNEEKEALVLTRMTNAVEGYLSGQSINASLSRLNQGTRAIAYLKERLMQQGYDTALLNKKNIRQLLRLQFDYDEEDIQTMHDNLKRLKNALSNMTPQERRMALMMIKRNQFRGNH